MKFFTKATSALAALVLTASPVWAKPNVFNLLYQCDSLGKYNACRELAKMAAGDRDADLRFAAVANLTDQPLLAKIAVGDQDANLRFAAVAKLTDQSLLAKIAVEDKDAEVRLNAVRELTDQSLLAKIAVGDLDDSSVRSGAVWNLTDQSLLAKITVEDKDESVRSAASVRLRGGGREWDAAASEAATRREDLRKLKCGLITYTVKGPKGHYVTYTRTPVDHRGVPVPCP